MENLRKPWQPGESGNPGGRVKSRPISELLRELLDETSVAGRDLPEGRTLKEVVAFKLVEAIISSPPQTMLKAVEILLDRIEGTASHDPLGETDNPLVAAVLALTQQTAKLNENGRPRKRSSKTSKDKTDPETGPESQNAS
jgi:hypothetical protein